MTVGSNINAIWYSRDAAGSWSSKAWVAEDGWNVIESVKGDAAISSDHDGDWAAWDAKSVSATPSAQTAALYEMGFLVGDPVGDMARQSGEFNEIVVFLKEIGYPAAEVPFEKENDDQCEPAYFLNWMCGVAGVAESGTATVASVDGAISAIECGVGWLLPHWTWTTTPPPAWGPTGPPTTPGDWHITYESEPVIITASTCFYEYTVTQTRTRSRARYYPGIGTITGVETQTLTCTYKMQCLNDASGPRGHCPSTPSCSTTPTGPFCIESGWSSFW